MSSYWSRLLATQKPPSRPRVHKPLPVAFQPLSHQTNPLGTAQRQAHAKTQAADRAIPSRPAPKVPYLLHPTAQQQKAAGKAIIKAADEHVLRRRDLQPTDPNDPEAVHLAAVAQHYARVGARDRLAAIGVKAARQAVGSRADGLTRGQAINLGSQVAAAQQAHTVNGNLHKVAAKKYIGIPGIPLARINIAPLESATIKFINNHTSLGSGDQATKLVKNALGDVVALGEAPAVGTFAGGEAVLQAAKGHPQQLKDFTSGLLKAVAADPAVQTVGTGLGIPGASLKKANASLVAHPGFALMDLDAGLGTVGRVAGATARALGKDAAEAGVRSTLAKIGDTRRSPIAMDSDAGLAKAGYVHDRRYSKDLTRRAVQKGLDAMRTPVRDARGEVVTVKVRGKDLPVLGPSRLAPAHNPHPVSKIEKTIEALKPNEQRRLQQKRGDFVASEAQGVETLARHTSDVELRKAETGGRISKVVKGKLAQDIVPLITSGTVRTGAHLEEDLTKRADRIDAQVAAHDRKIAAGEQGSYPTESEYLAAKENARVLRAAVANPKVIAQADKMAHVGMEYGKTLNEAERAQLDTSIGNRDQYDRGRLTEYASAHMGARNFTVEEHRVLERDAKQVEHAAAAKLTDARVAGAPDHVIQQLRQEHQAAREQRIAVSGRDPRGVIGHEAARQTVRKTAAVLERVQREHDHVVTERQRLIGAQRHTRSAQGRRAATPAERARLVAATDAREASAAKLAAATAQHEHALQTLKDRPLPAAREGIRYASGRHLPTSDIEAHARLHGRDPNTIAYLPHTEGGIGNRAFHKQLRPGTRPTEGSKHRTLHLYERGGNTFGRELVKEALTHKKTTIAKAQSIDRIFASGGRLHPIMGEIERGDAITQETARKLQTGGSLSTQEREIARGWSKEQRAIIANKGRFTGEGGLEAVRRLADQGHVYVAVREHTALPKDHAEKIRDTHDLGAMETANQDLLQSRLVTPGDADKAHNVVLLPGHEMQRLEEHLRPAGDLEKLVQMLNAPFRMAVLPQPRWLTGNFVEPYLIRLPLTGAGLFVPGAVLDARYATKYMSHLKALGTPAAKRELESIQAMLGGLFVGRREASVRRTFEDLAPGTWEHKAAVLAHFFRDYPGLKQLADLALRIPQGFFALNRHIESGAQRQALGKSIRADVHEFTGSFMKTLHTSADLFNEIGAGKLTPGTLQRWTKEQHDLLGKYHGFSPRTRRLVQSVAPFLPWTMASLRFVFLTMPLHHTAATALMVKMAQSISQQWSDQHQGVPPGELQAAQVTKKGGLVDFARYSPFGATIPLAEGQFQSLGDTFLPSVSSVYKAIQGQNPFGRTLQVQPTPGNPEGKASTGDILKIILNDLAEGFTPELGITRRVLEGGGTGYDNSNILSRKVKPGSKHMSGLRRALDPFRPTYLKTPLDTSATTPAGPASTGNPWIDAERAQAGAQPDPEAQAWANAYGP